MKQEIDNSIYRTSDLSLASALLTLGYHIQDIERGALTSRATFVINRDSELDNLIQLYFVGQLKVEPLSFFNNLKNIKTRVYNQGR